MTDEIRPDGGEAAGTERDVRRSGDNPPPVPSRSTVEELLGRLLENVESISTGYHIRARLAGDDPETAADQLVRALERKVTVVGSTNDAGIDPADPQLDVLIECEHTMSQVASALARVAPVDGAVVLEVSGRCQRIIEERTEEEEADAADANDVFSELQQQVSEADYDEVLDELENVSFPGGPDPDDEVDLEAAAGIELDESSETTDEPEVEGDIELDDEASTIDLDDDTKGMDPEEVGAKELFGEADADSDTHDVPAGEADPDAVSEAIESIEQDDSGVATDLSGADIDPEDLSPHPANDQQQVDDSSAAGTETETTVDSDIEQTANDSQAEVTSPTEGDTAGTADAHEMGATPLTGEQLITELLTALESGEVDADQRQALRDALGIESTHNLDVRLEYLQKRVDNLAAYTDAWEALIAEEGSGTRFVEEIRGDIERLEERVDSLDGASPDDALVDRIEEIESKLETIEVEERLMEMERSVEELTEEQPTWEEIDDRIESAVAEHIETTVSGIRERVEALEETAGSMRMTLKQFAKWREQVNDALRDR